jgi:nucleotide-binding universal stress UspA family protein
MKPILVPVDFSKSADNAAQYAVHLSKNIGSNIFLCHSFFVPGDAVGNQIAWPLYQYSTLEKSSTAQLGNLAKDLEVRDRGLTSPSSFHPSIFYSSASGGTTDMLEELLAEKRAGLIVMGLSGASAVSKFLFGSVSWETIEHAQCPVLLVPAEFRFKGLKKIAFATDLGSTDIQVIHSLAALAAHFSADLVVIHVSSEKQLASENDKQSETFLNEITNKVNYDRIYYRQIKNEDIDKGLDWLIENSEIDMMAMVHHKKGLLSKVLGGSHTKQLAGHISLPLLVYPSDQQCTF